MLNRRDVLKLAALAPAGAAMAASPLLARTAEAAAPRGTPQIKRYRVLGRTGQRVSDFCLGTGSDLGGPPVIMKALQMGVTYIDTAPDYGKSEIYIGEAWRKSGVPRDKFHITTKICEFRPYPGNAPVGLPAKKVIELVEGSLRRLRTDYVDNLFLHALGERRRDELDRLKDPEMLTAVDKLKKQGKVRFLGGSCHGPHKPLELLTYAIMSGHFDVIMPAYHIYWWPGLDKVIELAKQKGVGIIAMKALQGGEQAKKAGVLPPGDFAHAAFKWIWSNPAVAGVVATVKSVSQLEHYVRASGGTLAANERDGLTRMAAATSSSVCRIGCGDCLPRCPRGVAIPNVLRQDMYYTAYAEVGRARDGYAALRREGVAADACLSCADQACAGACTHGLPIRPALLAAHGRLA